MNNRSESAGNFKKAIAIVAAGTIGILAVDRLTSDDESRKVAFPETVPIEQLRVGQIVCAYQKDKDEDGRTEEITLLPYFVSTEEANTQRELFAASGGDIESYEAGFLLQEGDWIYSSKVMINDELLDVTHMSPEVIWPQPGLSEEEQPEIFVRLTDGSCE